MPTESTVPRTVPTEAEEQYTHLIRLAWDLRDLGLETRVELPLKKDPRLAVMLPVETLRVYAMLFSGQWFFSWGRGHMQRIDALADNAAQKIYEVATR